MLLGPFRPFDLAPLELSVAGVELRASCAGGWRSNVLSLGRVRSVGDALGSKPERHGKIIGDKGTCKGEVQGRCTSPHEQQTPIFNADL